MKLRDVFVQCYLDYLTSPMNPLGLGRTIGAALHIAAQHGVLSWDDFFAAIKVCHEAGFNPWDDRIYAEVPFRERWQHVRALLVFLSRVAGEFDSTSTV